jgi:hypothetical protein
VTPENFFMVQAAAATALLDRECPMVDAHEHFDGEPGAFQVCV